MWGSDRGREIVSELLTTLSVRGKSEIYLVGLSAGAVGAATLARGFESQLRGVALVSGAGPAIWDTKLPILFVYGRNDERFPPNLIAWIAKRTAPGNRSVMISEVDGDHLLAIKQHETLYTIVVEWLRNLAATGAAS
jgi:pimeloyl-ACP methyl ester carboxylesterase